MRRRISAILAIFMLLACFGCAGTPDAPEPVVSGTYIPDYYSDHDDPWEALYKTTLADPSKLRDGSPVYARDPRAWEPFSLFAGFESAAPAMGYDVRHHDLSGEDLSVVRDLNLLTFGTRTIWPDRLPDGFDPAAILEANKNPGLGIRALHERGITGKGVGIAIIDKTLLLGHEQYRENLVYYEEIHNSDEAADMHGPGVASLAVGRDIGVAPGSKLYYIANTSVHFKGNGEYEFDASMIADCILRVLEINENLPENEKIRVISISRGISPTDKGYAELTGAIKKADEAGIFVLTTSTDEFYDGFSLAGMGRDYLSDPEDTNSYLPANWELDYFIYNHGAYMNQNPIMFPMGGRTYAACTGTDEYEINSEGGYSWAVPWCAGFYALCCEVKPDITPREFIDAIYETGVTTQIKIGGVSYEFGKIVNPAGVIELLTQGN